MMVAYVDGVFGRRWSRLQTKTTTINIEILKHGVYKVKLSQAPSEFLIQLAFLVLSEYF